MHSYPISSGLKQTLIHTTLLARNDARDGYDVTIKFQSAKNLPRTDIIGYTDPYFIAKIDDHITYTSSIKSNTSAPVWNNEKWIVRNIPSNAKLTVRIYDKDDDTILDDYIGRFDIHNLINYTPPLHGHKIIGIFGQHHGNFYLSIESMRSSNETKHLPQYTFDGPCRYSRHDSLAMGRLVMINTDSIYSTWSIQIRRISSFFPSYEHQHWNREHRTAQAIFGCPPISLASQSPIKLAHRILYSQTLKHTQNGELNSADELWNLIFSDRTTHCIKPCIYTYIIDDHTWRFSPTGARFFIDYASKHALLANCSKHVRYAGEFHSRPRYGWDRCNDEWELVFDNGSGTYSPQVDLLVNLKELLVFNFPGLNVVTYDHRDPQMKESIKQLKLFMERQ